MFDSGHWHALERISLDNSRSRFKEPPLEVHDETWKIRQDLLSMSCYWLLYHIGHEGKDVSGAGTVLSCATPNFILRSIRCGEGSCGSRLSLSTVGLCVFTRYLGCLVARCQTPRLTSDTQSSKQLILARWRRGKRYMYKRFTVMHRNCWI